MTVTRDVNLQYTWLSLNFLQWANTTRSTLWRASKRHMKENLVILILTSAYLRTSIQTWGEGLHPIKPSFLDWKIRVIWFCLFIYLFGGGGGGNPRMQTWEELLCWLNTRVCIISVRINAWKAVKNLIFLGREIIFQVKTSKRPEKSREILKFSQSSDIQWNPTETKTTHDTLTWKS